MARLPLLGASYTPRSIIANAQRCINLFPEANPKDSPVPLTHYQRPGFKSLATAAQADRVCRGIYRTSLGGAFAVFGQSLYFVQGPPLAWSLTKVGTLIANKTTPVSMIDNRKTLWLVDGSTMGYSCNVVDGSGFAQINDPTGIFQGADRVDYIDTFMLANNPGTNQFISTLSNTLTFDPTYVAAKTDWPDNLVSLVVNRHEIILLGDVKSEIWFDAGNPQFPFAELPGAFIEHGVAAKYSVAYADISVFWLAQNLQGTGMVLRQRGYDTRRISNHALEYQIRKMATSVGISDAIGYTYQQDGHVFYVLQFPSGDQTWVFDDSMSEDVNVAWHQRAWTDGNGVLHRDRSNACAFIFGTNVVGDWENNTLYALDLDTYTDTVAGSVGPISYIRTFPHIGAGTDESGRPVMADGRRVEFTQFVADIECGLMPLNPDLTPAEMSLRWSDDRGRTFGNAVKQVFGTPGQYLTQPQWRTTGIARDRVFELSYSTSGPGALNGAWVDARVLKS